MAETLDFTAKILETEAVVKHTADGHIFHFPIVGNGSVGLAATPSRLAPRPNCEPMLVRRIMRVLGQPRA